MVKKMVTKNLIKKSIEISDEDHKTRNGKIKLALIQNGYSKNIIKGA